MVVIAQLVARRFHNPKVANSIVTHRMFLNVRRLILRLSISYRDPDCSFLPKTSRSVAIRPPRLTAAISQSRRSEVLHAGVSSRGYGATAARLTPDQKVGSLNLSALILHLMLTTRGNPGNESTSLADFCSSAQMFNLPCISAGSGPSASTGLVAQLVQEYG